MEETAETERIKTAMYRLQPEELERIPLAWDLTLKGAAQRVRCMRTHPEAINTPVRALAEAATAAKEARETAEPPPIAAQAAVAEAAMAETEDKEEQ